MLKENHKIKKFGFTCLYSSMSLIMKKFRETTLLWSLVTEVINIYHLILIVTSINFEH